MAAAQVQNLLIPNNVILFVLLFQHQCYYFNTRAVKNFKFFFVD
jgi:hypothetical protein